MYPYDLGIHLATGEVCRIIKLSLSGKIQQGFARITAIDTTPRNRVFKYRLKLSPYYENGELHERFMSIQRAEDVLRKVKAKPNASEQKLDRQGNE